jgi:hypothetical protein
MTEQRQFDLAYTGCAAAEYALRRVLTTARQLTCPPIEHEVDEAAIDQRAAA